MPNEAPARSTFIGGSDIAAVIGISPYTKPVELYVRKRSGIERSDNPTLRRGRLFEPVVRSLYTEQTGHQVRPSIFMRGPEPWICANLDGLVVERRQRVFEAKTSNPWTRADWGEEGTDSVPVYYTAQAQWYMGVARVDVCDLAALIGIDDFRVYTIEADPAIFAALVEAARKFWRRVQDGDPPPPTSVEDVCRLFPQHTVGESVEATDADIDRLAALKSVKDQIKALEQREEELKLALTQRIGGAEAIALDGVTLATWKTQEAKRVDVTALRQAQPALAEQFEKVSRSRVFRIK